MVRRRRVLSWATFLASLAALAVVASGSAASTTKTDDAATLSVAKKHSSSTTSSSSSKTSSSSGSSSGSSSSSSHTTKTNHHATPTITHPPPIACDPLPLNLSPADLCAHITAHCPSNGRIDYLDLYYCSPLPDQSDPGGGGGDDGQNDHLTPNIVARRALAMLFIILWMSFLFSCLGLVASDFFCPNLSTLASRLGLNESTAGVTFLALGNGSPDVFSTFSAMSTGSGALAVGELIGAASFIVSVVAGSMMLIQPFRVRRYPFIRDVGFFTVAVALTLACLVDGHLTLAESLALVALYLAYATVVIVGSMWEERQRRKRVAWERTRSDWRAAPGYQDDVVVGDRLQVDEGQYGGALHSPLPPRSPEYHVDEHDGREADLNADPFEVWASQQAASPRPVPGNAPPATPASAPQRPSSSSRASSRRNSPSTSPLLTPTGSRSSIGLPASSRLVRSASSKLRSTSVHHMPRHSLLGAVEFRDVVRSLTLQGQLAPLDDVAAEAQARAVAESRDPEAFLPHHHAHHHHHHQRGGHQRSHSHMNGAESAPQQQQQQQQQQSSPSSQASSSSRPPPSARGYSAPPPPGRGHQQNSFSLDVTSIDDPWKEHSANDGCDDAGAAGPSVSARTGGGAGHTAGSSSLSRLVIPDQSQADYHLAAAVSKANGDSGSKPTQSSKPSPAPSILILDENGQERVALAASPAGLDASSSPACCKTAVASSPTSRRRSSSSPSSSTRTTLHSLRHHLFPSLHHWRDKSILGKILSVVNAPPLLIFNLTLPVVDDEAEARAAARLGSGETTESEAYAEAEGAVRLKGNGETPLFARRADEVVEEDAHEVDDEEVLDLATGKRSRPHNVWDHDCDHAADGAADEEDDAEILDNKKRNLRVSRALRRLPAEETSPLTFGGTGSSPGENGIARPASPAPSNSSSSSGSSTESHDPLPTGNAKLILTTSQCLLAPTFCVWAATDLEPRGSLVLSLLVGVALAGGVVACTLRARRVGGAWLGRGTVSAFGLARCFLGFLVSIAFISVIVDEVVSILQALGLILGLSEAILGVTLFAMGNSLADLVANTVISRAGFPSMAIAACFAGPLLNLLLGIGASGTWLLSGGRGGNGGDGQYHFEISPTLLTSGVGLLVLLVGTLVLVPLNGFYLGRRLGWLLIGSYGVIMTINVLVEIFVDQRQGKGKGGKHHS